MSYHLIWQDRHIDLDDWKNFLDENYPDVKDEDALYNIAVSTNREYFDDEVINLNKNLCTRIVVIADLGLWNGRRKGYKVLKSTYLNSFLLWDDDCDSHSYYVEDGDVKGIGDHHDGTNYYTFRAIREDTSEADKQAILAHVMPFSDVIRCTRAIGPDVDKVYGWDRDSGTF